MPRVQVNDAVEISGTRKTSNGYLVADARIARTGVYTYQGADLGRPELGQVVVYRPPESVFDQESMASFAHKPITNDHPPEDVTSDNWKEYAVGYSGDQVVRDGGYVKVPLMVTDADSIKDIENGKKQLSAGYGTEIFFEDGVTPEGEPYQAKMGKPIGNHIAIVQNGRAGSECRIGDSYHQAYPNTTKEPQPMADRTVIVDSVSYTMSDQAAQVVERLQKKLNDAASAIGAKDGEIASLKTAHRAALDVKDGEIDAMKSTHKSEIEAKDGEIAAAKAQVLDGAALDAAIERRAAVVQTAKTVLGDSFDVKGLSEDAIRREVVVKRLGDSAKERPQVYIDAAFDALTINDQKAPPADPLRSLVLDSATKPSGQPTGVPASVKDADDAFDQLQNRLQNAWKTSKKDAA